MVKLRRQRKRKVYRFNVNRKRLRNKICNPGNIACKQIKEAWDHKKSSRANMANIGLCYDPNDKKALGINKKEKIKKFKEAIGETSEWDVEDMQTEEAPKSEALKALIEEAKAPRQRCFKLPKGQVEFLTYMLTKHGLDYKAMAKDRRNYNQETWKKLRSKIKTFQTIPDQYNAFLNNAPKEVLDKLQQNVPMDDDD